MKALKKAVFLFAGIFFQTTLFYLPALAGDYLLSAHGDSSAGVNRSSLSGYSVGNCAHCHEQHASVNSAEPSPTSGAPSAYALFADNFATSATTTPYSESDNFCFYCHTNSSSLQVGGISNLDYATTFGSSTTGSPTGIFEAFNLNSYHNLNDIAIFSEPNFSYFTSSSNPCTGCHNPHIAKRNKANVSDPSYTAISRPTDHDNLWGDDLGTNATDTERMSWSILDDNDYQPPYVTPGSTYEPGGIPEDSTKTPDYNTFCIDCHNTSDTIGSTSLGRNLFEIDWWTTGDPDKHGSDPADVSRDTGNPYASSVALPNDNYLLSCLDCHEPHGSPNSFLIRQSVNGSGSDDSIIFTDPDLYDPIDSLDDYTLDGTTCNLALDTGPGTPPMGLLCGKCHPDTEKIVHHDADDGPYIKSKSSGNTFTDGCGCHNGDTPITKISCEQCHFHGSIVYIPAELSRTGVEETRKTF